MALTNPYCQVTDLRTQLDDSSSKIDQALLERVINATSRAIERYCGGRRFWQDPSPVSRLYRPLDSDVLDVDDISSSAGLVVATGSGFSTVWATTDYQLEPLNADKDDMAFAWTRIRAVGANAFDVFSPQATVQVTAKFGWSAVPEEVKEACILKAVHLFKRKDAPFGFAGFADFGPVRISRQDSDVVELLHDFVLAGVA